MNTKKADRYNWCASQGALRALLIASVQLAFFFEQIYTSMLWRKMRALTNVTKPYHKVKHKDLSLIHI